MNFQQIVLARFEGEAPHQSVFMPDLTDWYAWHQTRGTLPEGHRQSTLTQIAAAINCPAWLAHSPWELSYQGVDVTHEETNNQRVIRYHTRAGVLKETWSIGPDGDWWQKEYPVKDEDDLDAAEEIVKARHYQVIPESIPGKSADPNTIDVIKLPKTPYSDMLHTLLGWDEGLMLMMGPEEDRLLDMLAIMEEKRQQLIQQLLDAPVSIILAPDNLDGQYISPTVFEEHLESSYQQTANLLHRDQKKLVVHIGGFAKHLVPLMAGCGIDALSGISGPPQSNATLDEARETAGPNITLWGGIPQDFVMPMHEEATLTASVDAALAFSETDSRAIIGIADHVPVDADIERLKAIAARINGR